MAVEYTLAIVKPDAVRKNKIGAIIAMAENVGLRVEGLRFVDVPEDEWRIFYADHVGKPFVDDLVRFMASGPVALFVLEGDGAIERWRRLMGATDSSKAEPGTVRALYGNPLVLRENAVHGSDGPANAVREIELFRP